MVYMIEVDDIVVFIITLVGYGFYGFLSGLFVVLGLFEI